MTPATEAISEAMPATEATSLMPTAAGGAGPRAAGRAAAAARLDLGERVRGGEWCFGECKWEDARTHARTRTHVRLVGTPRYCRADRVWGRAGGGVRPRGAAWHSPDATRAKRTQKRERASQATGARREGGVAHCGRPPHPGQATGLAQPPAGQRAAAEGPHPPRARCHECVGSAAAAAARRPRKKKKNLTLSRRPRAGGAGGGASTAVPTQG